MGLIGYQILNADAQAGQRQEGALYDYVLAENGVYLDARSERLSVQFPVAPARVPLRGLKRRLSHFLMHAPPVPAGLLAHILTRSAQKASEGLEVLFHLSYSPLCPTWEGWMLDEPAQKQAQTSCRPLEDGPGSSHDRALIEVHSHHVMPARFSPQDNREETGFRIYAVIGGYPDWRINLRVGVYGHFWEIPSELVFENPGLAADVDPPAYPEALGAVTQSYFIEGGAHA